MGVRQPSAGRAPSSRHGPCRREPRPPSRSNGSVVSSMPASTAPTGSGSTRAQNRCTYSIGRAGRGVVAAEELDRGVPVARFLLQFACCRRERILTVDIEDPGGDLREHLPHGRTELLHQQHPIVGQQREHRGGVVEPDDLPRLEAGPSLDVDPDERTLVVDAARPGLRHGSAGGRQLALRLLAAIDLGGADEIAEQRMRPGGPRSQLGVELARDEERVVGQLDDLGQPPLLRGTR